MTPPAAPPRVLLITGSLGRGGTELAVSGLARGLAGRQAYTPSVAVLSSGGAMGEALRAEGIPVHELGLDGPIRTPRSRRTPRRR